MTVEGMGLMSSSQELALDSHGVGMQRGMDAFCRQSLRP